MSVVDQIAKPAGETEADRVLDGPSHVLSARPAQSAASEDSALSRVKNLALMLLVMAQFAMIIDASIVNVGLPSIGSSLHFSRADLSWVLNAYTLCFRASCCSAVASRI